MQSTILYGSDCLRKKGRPKYTWKRHVKEEIKKTGFKDEDASNHMMWKKDVLLLKYKRVGPATSANEDKTG